MEFEEKFIAFIDVLGFKNMVEESEAGDGIPLSELMAHLSKFGSSNDEKKFMHGHTYCPQSEFISNGLNFKITQISDCAIISSEISPSGVINLLGHCTTAVTGLLMQGIMCRGYITRGSIYHQNNQVIGSGYQEAYAKESGVTAFKIEADERGTPFVEVDDSICNYIASSDDSCIKEMFSRMSKTEDGITALFPFQRLSHSFMMAEDFDPQREKENNDNIRQILNTLVMRVERFINPSNEKAVKKSRHYIKAIREQLRICDKTDEAIDKLCQPFPR